MKKIVITLMAAAFALSVGTAFAAKVKCTVDSVEGETVTMTCKKADKLKVGDKVSVKAKKQLEGC